MMNQPIEVMLMTFEHLSRKDLRSCRLVSRLWHTWLAERFTIDTLYLSPREMDMEIFDAITHDPYLRRNIRHLVFDAAQFIKRSKTRYYETLCRQFQDKNHRILHSSNPDIQHLKSLIVGPERADDFERWNIPVVGSFERCSRDPVFLEGFARYRHLAEEQGNICSQSWFERACHGLQRIVSLESVALRNTWDMLVFAEIYDSVDITSDIRGTVDGNIKDVEAQEMHLSPTLVWLNEEGDTFKGRSPVARSWPPTALLPMGRVHPWDEPNPTRTYYGRRGLSDGSLELLKLFEILKATCQQPSEIILLTDWNNTGVPPIVFDISWTSSACFPTICGRLRTLNIELAHGATRSLHGLQCILQNAPALRNLSLQLPYDGYISDEEQDWFCYSHVFPGIGWRHSTLSSLDISGLSATYRELAALLFLNLPQLESLRMSFVNLIDGGWEDIIEGLRYCDNLQSCQIEEPLTYPNDHFYCRTNPSDPWLSDRHYEFLAAVSHYVNEGGRHPSLVDGEQDRTSAKYMMKLDETLRELRGAE